MDSLHSPPIVGTQDLPFSATEHCLERTNGHAHATEHWNLHPKEALSIQHLGGAASKSGHHPHRSTHLSVVQDEKLWRKGFGLRGQPPSPCQPCGHPHSHQPPLPSTA
ncbi:hypothetical protein LEMLEM_LOCUS7633, partial [Lemmus lemmus]